MEKACHSHALCFYSKKFKEHKKSTEHFHFFSVFLYVVRDGRTRKRFKLRENVAEGKWYRKREKESFNFAIYVFEQCANWFCLLCVVSNNFFNAMLSGKRCCDFNLIGAFVFVRVWEMVLCFVCEPYPFDAALGHFSFGLNKSLFTHTHTSVTMHACVYCMCWGVQMPKGDKQSEPMNTKKSHSLILMCLHCPHLPSIDSVLRSSYVLQSIPDQLIHTLHVCADKVFLDQFYSWTLCTRHLVHALPFACPAFPFQQQEQNCIC